jgi:hypothetical protein
VDKNGWQVFKADIHPEGTPPVQVNKRQYFLETKAERLWHLSTERDRDESPFAQKEDESLSTERDREQRGDFIVQTLRAISTGELRTVLSIRSTVPKSCTNAPYIAVISMAPLSVERPVLPTGYSFAIIAADGQVLYHSDPRRTLKEDFFSQVRDSDALHSAINGLRDEGASALLSTYYGRVPMDLNIRKLSLLAGPHWFIVTMRDRRWLNAVATETLIHATMWCLTTACAIFLAVLLTLSACLRQTSSRAVSDGPLKRILRWLWPDPAKESLYQVLAVSGGVLSVAGVAAICFWRVPQGPGLFWFSILYPLAGILVALTEGSNSGRLPKKQGKTWAGYYTAAVATLLTAIAVVPAVGLFRHGWNREMDKIERFEASSWAVRWRDWTAKDKDNYANIAIKDPKKNHGDNDWEYFFSSRQNRSAWFRVRYSRASVQRSRPDDWLDQRLPLL